MGSRLTQAEFLQLLSSQTGTQRHSPTSPRAGPLLGGRAVARGGASSDGGSSGLDPKEKLRVVTSMHCIALGDISGGTLDV